MVLPHVSRARLLIGSRTHSQPVDVRPWRCPSDLSYTFADNQPNVTSSRNMSIGGQREINNGRTTFSQKGYIRRLTNAWLHYLCVGTQNRSQCHATQARHTCNTGGGRAAPTQCSTGNGGTKCKSTQVLPATNRGRRLAVV